MPKTHYSYMDKVLEYLRKKFVRSFRKKVPQFDELNVIQHSHDLYDGIEAEAEECYLKIAEDSYKFHLRECRDENFIGEKKMSALMALVATVVGIRFIRELLDEYDRITKYVYSHEVERKRARYAESIIASEDNPVDRDRAMRLFYRQVAQKAIEVTDEAGKQAYRDAGVKWVKWVTKLDGRECQECKDRNGNIYRIDEVPRKPHINCRCTLKPYRMG